MHQFIDGKNSTISLNVNCFDSNISADSKQLRDFLKYLFVCQSVNVLIPLFSHIYRKQVALTTVKKAYHPKPKGSHFGQILIELLCLYCIYCRSLWFFLNQTVIKSKTKQGKLIWWFTTWPRPTLGCITAAPFIPSAAAWDTWSWRYHVLLSSCPS